MLLRVETNDEGGDVDNLLADADVTLTDQDTSVMDGLSETEFVDLGLFWGLVGVGGGWGVGVIGSVPEDDAPRNPRR